MSNDYYQKGRGVTMVDEPNPQCPHCIHREVCKNAEKYREIMIHISNEVGNMPDWLAYRLVCKDFKEDVAYRSFDPYGGHGDLS